METKNTAIITTVTVVNPTIWRRSSAVLRRQRTISDARAISQPRLTRVDQKYDSAGLEMLRKLYSLVRVGHDQSGRDAEQDLPEPSGQRPIGIELRQHRQRQPKK